MTGAKPVARTAPSIPIPRGKIKNVIHNNVGEASREHGGHTEVGRAVVADKAVEDIVDDEGRRKQKHYLEVDVRHLVYRSVRTQKCGDFPGKQKPDPM